ncbi:hypothetical protein EYF80_037488 [Liparis tanakae]|uniref:Uncharacterized protein n=1 Tax=Liparis tanakae TaxID=230148 RepID=A0A4Z2GHU5_9TELE|nr:hypothetical protein EYF80_037488 [Liparis tanakae]
MERKMKRRMERRMERRIERSRHFNSIKKSRIGGGVRREVEMVAEDVEQVLSLGIALKEK